VPEQKGWEPLHTSAKYVLRQPRRYQKKSFVRLSGASIIYITLFTRKPFKKNGFGNIKQGRG
jgi:hypothetical protein